MRKSTLRSLLFSFGLFPLLGASAQDGYISEVSMPRYIKAGVNFPIQLQVQNNGPGNIPSFSIRWRIDGGAWNNGNTVNITPPGLPTDGYYMQHTHQTPINVSQGAHTLELNLVFANDPSPANNTVTIPFTALSSWADKVVLLEARTETWCPQCPAANTITNGLISDPDLAIVKFHLNDALDDCVECINYYNQYNITYTPAGIIEMGEYGSYAINYNTNSWPGAMAARAIGVSPVELNMTTSVNATTRVLTATLTAEFTYAFEGPFNMNIYVAEDNVAGPQSAAPSGYIHQRVMRAMLGGVNGTAGVVPNTPVAGTTYSHTYTWTVPANYDINDLHLVGILEHEPTNFANRYTVNAVNRSATGVGIDELSLGDDRLSAYPSPFDRQLNIRVADHSGPATVELIGMDGRVAFQQNVVLNSTSASPIDLSGAALANGAYVLRVATSEGTAAQRIIKMD